MMVKSSPVLGYLFPDSPFPLSANQILFIKEQFPTLLSEFPRTRLFRKESQ